MTPAQRRKRIRGFKDKSRKKPVFRLLLLVFLLAFVFYLVLNTKYWNSKEKLSLALVSPEGGVVVTVLDPVSGEITNISIPKNTQVEAARQLGTWKIKSIWALGVNEKLGGSLLKDTILKNFKFPVSVWANRDGAGFASGGTLKIIKAMFFPYDTNLRLGDRLRIGIFSLGVTGFKRTDIDLAKGSYLRGVRLTDGEEGYVLSGKIPKDLLVVFSDPGLARAGLKVSIKDASGDPVVAEEVAEIIEVMGAKVAAVSREPRAPSDCAVRGENFFAKDVAKLLACKIEKASPEGSFDLELEIGERFAARF